MDKPRLFNNKIKPKCIYCKNSIIKNNLYCNIIKKNVKKDDMCNLFNYCPLKRVPVRKLQKFNFKKEDFEI